MKTKEFLLSGWNWSPAVLAICAIVLIAYLAVFRAFAWHKIFLLGLGLLLFANTEMSPLGSLADGYLFSAHMVQHLLLLLIVPAVLLLSLPDVKSEARGKENGSNPNLRASLLSWLAGVGAMWLWHIPMLCNAATTNGFVQKLQTISLLSMGTLFWWPLLRPDSRLRLAPLAGVAYLFTACMACTLLGIYITFSPLQVCAAYHHPVDRLGILPLIRRDWGLTTSVDQQIGGLLMWVPSCLIYLVGIIAQLARWYGTEPEVEPSFAAVAESGNAGQG
jgi:putative membrane protein